MILVRALYCSVCGSFGMLLFGGTALAQAAATTGSIGTNSVETSPIDMNAVDSVDECMVAQICIDRYLWSLYTRTRKIDTVKVPEQTKVTVKQKGKTRIVTKTTTKFVEEDFTWKDPNAAERVGMSPMDYVIGGMDPNFRVTLYHALRALDNAGLMPGITCAFRDDYRQTIATGQKAQSDRSYHGGSFRGGYGHGLAADVVSVKGETRAERLVSSRQMWDWIDMHEKELGIGRPYLDRDAPHVAPIDGAEYAAHRVEPNTRRAESKTKEHQRLALHTAHDVKPNTRPAESKIKEHQRLAPAAHHAEAKAKEHQRPAPAARHVEPNTQHAESKAKEHQLLALAAHHTEAKAKEHQRLAPAAHHIEPNTQHAESKAKEHQLLALHHDHSVLKRARVARP